MKSLVLPALALLATVGLALPASGGDGKPLAGCGCANQCPLAQEANQHRATGEEAVFASATARRELVRVLVANLSAL